MNRVVILFIVLLHLSLVGKAQKYLYQYITVKEGLPSNYVTSMFFDKEGIFWIGTDKGICRYDGANTQIVTADDGMAGNFVQCIFQDKVGYIWVGCLESGLTELEIIGEKPLVKQVIRPGYSIRKISKDHNGVYWIKGFDADKKNYKCWTAAALTGDWRIVATSEFENQVQVDDFGKIHFTNFYDLVWHDTVGLSVRLMQSPSWVEQILLSKNRLVQVGKTKMEVHDTGDDSMRFIFGKQVQFMPTRFVDYLHAGEYDFFFKTGFENYVFYNHELINVLNRQDFGSIPFIFSSAVGPNNHIFLAHFGQGILVWRKGYLQEFEFTSPPNRIAVQGKKVFVNAENSLFTFQSSNAKPATTYVPNMGDINFPIVNKDSTVLVANNGEIFTLAGRIIQHYEKKFTDFSDGLFFKDAIYITSYSHGISRIRNSQIDTAWQNKLQLPTTCLERLRNSKDKIYALTLSNGFLEIDPQTGIVTTIGRDQGLLSNSVYELFAEDDTTWVGTLNGLNIIFGNQISRIDKSMGFNGSRVVCIFRDTKGSLWVLSDTYLHLYINGRLYAIRSFPVIVDNYSFIVSASYQKATNKLWVVTNKNLLVIEIDNVVPDIGNYAIGLHRVATGDLGLSLEMKSFKFSYDHEPLRFTFSNPNYSIYNKAMVFYRLVGFQDDWQQLPDDNSLIYNKLPPGKYAIEIKTEGPDLGSVPPTQLLAFEVLHPWWKRWPFVLGCLIIVAMVTFVLSRMIAKRKFGEQLKVIEAEKALQLERVRIGRELHDNIGSMLTLMINRIDDDDDAGLKQAQKSSVSNIARYTLAQLRDAIWALDKEKVSTYQWINHTTEYLEAIPVNGTVVKCSISWDENLSLSPLIALHSFRIVQEATTNAIKHARASQIIISGFHEKEFLVLEITDNGCGYNPETIKVGYGLRNMQKRANEIGGEFVVRNNDGAGTKVSLKWKPEE